MAKSSITAFEISRIQEQVGLRKKKTVTDELLKMETPGGAVFLRKSALERAGDDWSKWKGRIRNLAGEKNIPYTDHTLDT